MDNLIIADEKIRKLLDKVGKITKTNYTDYSINSLICAFEDLLYEFNYLQEEIEEMEQDIEDNYKPISMAEEIGFNERDFI